MMGPPRFDMIHVAVYADKFCLILKDFSFAETTYRNPVLLQLPIKIPGC